MSRPKGFHLTQKHKENLRNSHLREKSALWKGGKIDLLGYVYIRDSDKKTWGYIAEHRLIVEKYLGRKLKNEEVVHHINGIRNDNRIENLLVLKNFSSHMQLELGNNLKTDTIIFDGRWLQSSTLRKK